MQLHLDHRHGLLIEESHPPYTPLFSTMGKWWLQEEGLLKRAEMLAHQTVYRAYNYSLQTLSEEVGAVGYYYDTAGDENVCELCKPFEGKFYRIGQYLPYVPRHPNCRCILDPVFRRKNEWIEQYKEETEY